MNYFSIFCTITAFILLLSCGIVYIIEDWIPICNRLLNIGLIFGVVGFIVSLVDSLTSD